MNEEQRIEKELLDGDKMEVNVDNSAGNQWQGQEAPQGGAQPPAMPRGGAVPPGGLMNAIQNGMAQMGRVIDENQNMDRRAENNAPNRMVRLISDSESSEDEAADEPQVELAPAAYRQAEQAKSNKDAQATLRRELMEGLPPGKFAKAFPILYEVKTHTQRDAAASEFVEKIVTIADKLEKINIALVNEQCPYAGSRRDIIRELTLAAASSELIQAMLEVPQDAPFARWRVEAHLTRSLVCHTPSPILMRLKMTHRMFKNSIDFINNRYKGTNSVDLAKYFSQELEDVVYNLGMKKKRCPTVPAELVNHPEYGRYIQELVSPYKSLKHCIKSAKNQIADMGKRSLDELIQNMEDDCTAGRIKGLLGLPHTKNSTVVVISATNKYVHYKLSEDGIATELDYLPDWAKGCHVVSNKKFFTPKRRNDKNNPNGDGKRPRKF